MRGRMDTQWPELTIKQAAFVREVVRNGGNATEAYRKAYGQGNSTDATISRHAHKNMTNPAIKARYQELCRAASEKDIAASVNRRAKLIRALEGIALDADGLDHEDKDRIAAIKLLMQNEGMLTEKKEIKGELDTTIRIEEAD